MARTPCSGATGGRYTRRRLLKSGVATVGGLAVVGSGLAAGQSNDITTDAVIVEQDEFEQNLLGFWIHIQGEVSANDAAAIDDDCEAVDWSNDETVGYDAKLIDRTADPQSATITLYLNERVEITPGDLFIINNRQQCRSGYVGIQIERISANPGVSADSTAADETPASGDGAGFGAISALAGALGAGWLLNRRRED